MYFVAAIFTEVGTLTKLPVFDYFSNVLKYMFFILKPESSFSDLQS